MAKAVKASVVKTSAKGGKGKLVTKGSTKGVKGGRVAAGAKTSSAGAKSSSSAKKVEAKVGKVVRAKQPSAGAKGAKKGATKTVTIKTVPSPNDSGRGVAATVIATAAPTLAPATVTLDRRRVGDRRERFARPIEASIPTRVTMERRKKKPRRRQIDPTTCERDYSQLEIEFMQAVDAFKHRTGNRFPTCAEVLAIIVELGYVRDGEVLDPVAEFSRVFEDYKQTSGRMFPTCSEVLEVILGLGYGKPDTGGAYAWCGGNSSREDF